MAATIKFFREDQMLRLKKAVSSPMVNIPAGTTQTVAWFSHMMNVDISQLMWSTRSQWFDRVN